MPSMASDTPKADAAAARRRAWGLASEASPRPARADSLSLPHADKEHAAVLHVNGRGLMSSVSMGPERGTGAVAVSIAPVSGATPHHHHPGAHPGAAAEAAQQAERPSSSSDTPHHHHHHHHHHHQHQQQWLSPRLLAVVSSPLFSEFLYCTMSAGTTLFNKHALSTFNFPAPNMLLFFQFALAVLLLQALDVFGVIWLQPLRADLVRLWLPVNLIFVAMNVTGFYALRDIGAGMFTVLKNLSNLMTIAGDYVFFGNTYSWQVWGCLGLMILSALLGGWTDAQFSLRGYAWQLVNCLFTAAYSLYLSGVIRRLSKNPHSKPQLSELSMVYYNNLLSVPPLALLSVFSGELTHLRHAPQLRDSSFQMVAVVGGLLGFGVSFASIWCMSRTSATIYSLTGSMNKVVVALCGMWYFHEKTSFANMCSIAAGLAAGFLFVFAKSSSNGGRHGPSSSGGGGGAGGGGSGGGSASGDAAVKEVLVLAPGGPAGSTSAGGTPLASGGAHVLPLGGSPHVRQQAMSAQPSIDPNDSLVSQLQPSAKSGLMLGGAGVHRPPADELQPLLAATARVATRSADGSAQSHLHHHLHNLNHHQHHVVHAPAVTTGSNHHGLLILGRQQHFQQQAPHHPHQNGRAGADSGDGGRGGAVAAGGALAGDAVAVANGGGPMSGKTPPLRVSA